MILAAGRGERMRPLTDTIPKPLLPVGGKPLIVWQIERLVAAGIRDIVINHAHLGQQLEDALGDGHAWGAHITWSPETEALETAGGILKALPHLGPAPFLVVSADIYCECDYRALLKDSPLDDGAQALLWMVANPSWHPAGDFPLRDNRLHLKGAGGKQDEPCLTYANFGLFRPEMFTEAPELTPGKKLPLRPLLDRLIPAGRIQGAKLSGLWDNLGTPEQLAQLDNLLDTRRHREERSGSGSSPGLVSP